MFFTSAIFTEFDLFKHAAAYWDLDFRLLSKNDFSSDLALYSNNNFQIGRTALRGKIEQKGLCPKGFRSFVIPVDYHNDFYWLNKKVSGNQLLIFPKNGILDGVSDDNFDVYVVSIEEQYLRNTIDKLCYKNISKLLNENEQRLFIDKRFSGQFQLMASEFMQECKNGNLHDNPFFPEKVDHIIHSLLRYLEHQNLSLKNVISRKRDIALGKSVEFINESIDDNINIATLCQLSGVSERTLDYAFKEKYQVSPKDYIKALKLHKIRSELLSSEDVKISSLAAQYGFWHMGQFAADYKKWFGVLPSQTKRFS